MRNHSPDFTRLIEREIGQRYLVGLADAQVLDSRKPRMIDLSIYFLPTTQVFGPKQGRPMADKSMRGSCPHQTCLLLNLTKFDVCGLLIVKLPTVQGFSYILSFLFNIATKTSLFFYLA
ncbi:hypothetical protein CPB83DRAFT_862171 [Crepidotus variabilis]|uniref:Uncharacterized protein n=1 Tax=Crepidotus variabilis TaxID=179855 RepID=A0A9P6E7D0_9AGAR|nr:hypothetical protein CPB83DRAFT_862171 [Crepidotus variabilis]